MQPSFSSIRPRLLLAGILLVAANLRASISAVGPVLPNISEDTTLGAAELGVLVAIPVLGFALVSPIVSHISQFLGADRTVQLALLILLLGIVGRSMSWFNAGLWFGTAAIGVAIAIGNVFLPVATKRDFPDRISLVTGQYIAVQSIFAALASGLVVPIMHATDSWELAIGIWAVPVVLALVTWSPRLTKSDPHGLAIPKNLLQTRMGQESKESYATKNPSIWASWPAWHVAVYFQLQSSIFYILMNWLPVVEQSSGVAPTTAGLHLSMFLAVGIVANLSAPAILKVGNDERFATVVMPLLMTVSLLGMLAIPALQALWVAISGVAAGGAMVVSLSLISLRAANSTAAGRLSSMVQSVASLGVSLALILSGLFQDTIASGSQLLFLPLGLAVMQVVAGVLAWQRSTPIS